MGVFGWTFHCTVAFIIELFYHTNAFYMLKNISHFYFHLFHWYIFCYVIFFLLVLNINNFSLIISDMIFFPIISRPGQSQGLLYKHLCDWLSISFSHPLVKISLLRRHAQMVKNGDSSHNTNYIDIFFRDSKSWRASKLLYWFKSHGDFGKWVDFAYWWSFIGKGLGLQPA